MPKTPNEVPDRQLTGLAGELFVAAELLKRRIQTSVTFGHAKAIDLLAFNPRTKGSFQIQVKCLRKKTGFPIGRQQVVAEHAYVFVILNEPGEPAQFFIVPGRILRDRRRRFRGFDHPSFPGILPSDLKMFEGKWSYFEDSSGKPANQRLKGTRRKRRAIAFTIGIHVERTSRIHRAEPEPQQR